MQFTRRTTPVCFLTAVLTISGCDGDSIAEPGESTGLSLSVFITGTPEDSNMAVIIDSRDHYGVPPILGGGLYIEGLAPGHHVVELADVPSNCSVNGTHQSEISLEPYPGLPTNLAFHVSCTCLATLDQERVFFYTNRDIEHTVGRWGSWWPVRLHSMDTDGEGQVPWPWPGFSSACFNETGKCLDFAISGESAKFGNISPDGTRAIIGGCSASWSCGFTVTDLCMSRPFEIRLQGTDPRWSPSGEQVLFWVWPGINELPEVRVADADGTGESTLIVGGSNPAWSPDGSDIAFIGWTRLDVDRPSPFSNNYISVMKSDGSDAVRIVEDDTTVFISGPEWFADGSLIAFRKEIESDYCGADIFVVSPDGSNLANVTQNKEEHGYSCVGIPSLSADGTMILFGAHDTYADESATVVVSVDGSRVAKLEGTNYSWLPYGSRLLFSCNTDVCVSEWDGTGRMSLTNNPAVDAALLWWAPSTIAVGAQTPR